MAKITDLPPVDAELYGDDFIPVVQAGTTKRATMTALRTLITPFLQNWYKGDRGDTGASNNTRRTLAELRAAPLADVTSLFDGSLWTLRLGNFAGQIDDATCVASNYLASWQGAWIRDVGATLTPEMFGAVGDGYTDDTAAMRRFFQALCAFPLGTVGVGELRSGRCYLHGHPGDNSVIWETSRGFRLIGNGATIKAADGGIGWGSLLGSTSPMYDQSGLSITGVTFDGNIENAGSFNVSNGLLEQARHVVLVKNGTGLDFNDNTVKNLACTNAAIFNGDTHTSDMRINRNRFLNIGGKAGVVPYHDHSAIYATGDNIEVCDNYFGGTEWGSPGAVCMIEVHPGTGYKVTGNRGRKFHTGINVAGIYEHDSRQGSVTGNDLETLRRGIAIYSGAYDSSNGQHSDPAIDHGIDGLLIDANKCRIRNALPKGGMSGGGPGCFGIASVAATLPIRDLTIGGANQLTFDRETAAPDWDGIPVGVGITQDGGAGRANIVFENIRIGDLTIVNAPVYAIALGTGGGVFRNCAIGDPTLIRPGSTASTTLASFTYRSAFWIVCAAVEGTLSVGQPRVVDDADVPKLTRLYVLSVAQPSSAIVDFGGRITLRGAPDPNFRVIEKGNNNVIPQLRIETNFPFVGDPGAIAAVGSEIYDRIANVRYRTLATGDAWKRHFDIMVAPAGAYADQETATNHAAGAGAVRDYVSVGGEWKALTTISS